MRLFLVVDDCTVATITGAKSVPRVGEAIWCKTIDYEGDVIVQIVQHQFDRSAAEHYLGHDVSLRCRKARDGESGTEE